MTLSSADSFPRRSARTLRFTAGAPRAFQLSPDGTAVTFLRSSSGTDRAASLRILDADTGTERLVADPAALLSGGDENLSQEERSRRERMREGGAGITGYACDAKHTVAAFALSSPTCPAPVRASCRQPGRCSTRARRPTGPWSRTRPAAACTSWPLTLAPWPLTLGARGAGCWPSPMARR